MNETTANSRGRAPGGRWAVTWVASLVLTAAFIGGWDLYLRGIGYQPSVSDSADLWALHRGRVYPRSPDDSVLVLVGGSRIAQAISLPALEEALPGFRVVQLAIVGSSAWSLIEDLATDRRFRGVVLASVMESSIIYPWGQAQEYVDNYRSGPRLNSLANAWIDAHVEELTTARVASVRLSALVGYCYNGRDLRPNYSIMDFDRARRSDFSKVDDLPRLRFRRLSRARLGLGSDERVEAIARLFSARVARLGRMVSAIERRGGRVALVKFPIADEVTRVHGRTFPRNVFWDKLDSLTGATTLHYLDDRSLQGFSIPDASHLDQSERDAFTVALVEALRERGFFHPVANREHE